MNAAKAMEVMAQDGRGLDAVWQLVWLVISMQIQLNGLNQAPTKLKLAPGCYVGKCQYVMEENDDGDTVGVSASTAKVEWR